MITLNISLHTNPRERGFWKLNTSLLVDADYIDLIKRIIKQTKQVYENDITMTPALLFGAAKKHNTRHKELELEERIALLKRELEDLPASAPQKTNLNLEKLN